MRYYVFVGADVVFFFVFFWLILIISPSSKALRSTLAVVTCETAVGLYSRSLLFCFFFIFFTVHQLSLQVIKLFKDTPDKVLL